MSEETIQIGQTVQAFYKTGKYIGEVTAIKPSAYLVKILAVINHPMQGDLHNPKQTDVSMFHQRRALAYREQTNVPLNMVKPYTEEIPEYEESLKAAVAKMKGKLTAEDTEWNQMSLRQIEELEKDYFK
ncbi:kinase-associated lipoprotein B [Bacillus massiliglaciei]|uniref:kinase-associated lipoprotein B n=1 Tax=Bacillus massiliglaciei TaxID=1816693 RepID=UPI000A423CC9|nr:kinase-associated lipoprotein B [Bacillus massiliglaciei]